MSSGKKIFTDRQPADFSIIVPVYNAEATICRCLDSLLNQNYSNFEVLVIDDGSADSSVDIIEEYMSRDARFRLIKKKKNSGPSAARNTGIENACGSVISFVDADDYVTPEYLFEINKCFADTNADVVFFEYYRKNGTDRYELHSLPEYREDFYENVIHLTRQEMFGYTWIKAIKTDIIGTSRFDENIRLLEDEAFTCSVLRYQPKISFCYRPLYVYVRGNQETLSLKKNPDYPLCCEMVYQGWKNLLNGPHRDVLVEKADHMLTNCRYYGLEKRVNPLKFWGLLGQCEFVNDVSIQDGFVDAVKSYNRLYLSIYWLYYNIKIVLSSVRRGK